MSHCFNAFGAAAMTLMLRTHTVRMGNVPPNHKSQRPRGSGQCHITYTPRVTWHSVRRQRLQANSIAVAVVAVAGGFVYAPRWHSPARENP